MKTTRKFMAILMVLAMVLSMGVLSAFAADTTLTIKTTAGHTYKVYQLLVGDVSDNLSNGHGTLTNTTIGSNVKDETTVADVEAAIKDKADEELGNAAFGLIDTTKDAKTVTGTGEDVLVTVAQGYYVVVDTWTGNEIADDVLSRYLVAVAGPTTMTPKVSKPEIDKDIIDTDNNAPITGSDNKADTAAIGDVIEYEITGKVPNTEGYTYYYYVVNDTMSEGLTLNQGSFEVTIGGKTMTKGTEYNVYFDAASNSFELAFADLKTLVDTADNGVSVNADISIKYTATINDNAAIGTDPNTNTAKLVYSNNPGESTKNDVADKPGVPQPGTATGEGPEKTTNTYVTELTILKVDNDYMKLEGAQFTLSGTNLNKVIVETNTTFVKVGEGETGEYYKLLNGTYTKTAPSDANVGEEGYNANLYESTTPEYNRVTDVTASSTDATADKIVASVNDEGYIVFTGLSAGDYTLSETVTPDGYNTMSNINFTISATVDNNGKITWASSNDNIVVDAENGVFDATIVNYPGSSLPTTGGMGTVIFIAVGSLIAVAAVCFLVTKKRMQNRGMN